MGSRQVSAVPRLWCYNGCLLNPDLPAAVPKRCSVSLQTMFLGPSVLAVIAYLGGPKENPYELGVRLVYYIIIFSWLIVLLFKASWDR